MHPPPPPRLRPPTPITPPARPAGRHDSTAGRTALSRPRASSPAGADGDRPHPSPVNAKGAPKGASDCRPTPFISRVGFRSLEPSPISRPAQHLAGRDETIAVAVPRSDSVQPEDLDLDEGSARNRWGAGFRQRTKALVEMENQGRPITASKTIPPMESGTAELRKSIELSAFVPFSSPCCGKRERRPGGRRL